MNPTTNVPTPERVSEAEIESAFELICAYTECERRLRQAAAYESREALREKQWQRMLKITAALSREFGEAPLAREAVSVQCAA